MSTQQSRDPASWTIFFHLRAEQSSRLATLQSAQPVTPSRTEGSRDVTLRAGIHYSTNEGLLYRGTVFTNFFLKAIVNRRTFEAQVLEPFD